MEGIKERWENAERNIKLQTKMADRSKAEVTWKQTHTGTLGRITTKKQRSNKKTRQENRKDNCTTINKITPDNSVQRRDVTSSCLNSAVNTFLYN